MQLTNSIYFILLTWLAKICNVKDDPYFPWVFYTTPFFTLDSLHTVPPSSFCFLLKKNVCCLKPLS